MLNELTLHQMSTTRTDLPRPSEFNSYWGLDPSVVFLNHGSFGACPLPVLEKQTNYRTMLEAETIRFMLNEMPALYDRSAEALAKLVQARREDLVFVRNATEGVNVVFRSLRFEPGDEIIFTSHIYGACRKVLEYVAGRTGAVLREVTVGFPVGAPDEIIAAVLAAVTPRTRIALIDHITSPTAMIQPVAEIVEELAKRGIDTMVDGAHAPGMVPLDLDKLGAAYYTANCHKWLCAPKGVGMLHVRADRQDGIVPAVISHAGHIGSSFAERFFWSGTTDPSAILAVADAIEFTGSLLPGGWDEVMRRNRSLCLEARKMICDELGITQHTPDAMTGSMASFPIPAPEEFARFSYMETEPLQQMLMAGYGIEIPVWNWDYPTSRLLRFSVQLYNSIEQYRYLARALKSTLAV